MFSSCDCVIELFIASMGVAGPLHMLHHSNHLKDCLTTEQNKQGTQSPDTQTKKQENAGQNQQSGAQNQQPSAKDKPYGSASTEYGSQQGEDEKDDDQEGTRQGSVTSQRDESSTSSDQDS